MVQKVKFPYGTNPDEVKTSEVFSPDEDGNIPEVYLMTEMVYEQYGGEVWYED